MVNVVLLFLNPRRGKLFLIMFSISLLLSTCAAQQEIVDYYQNLTGGISEIFGLPSISHFYDEGSGLVVITHVSSETQQNKYLCFRVSCDRDGFSIIYGNEGTEASFNNYKGQSNLYCVNAVDLPDQGYMELRCYNNVVEEMSYTNTINTLYDITFDSPSVIKKYEDPRGEYANEVYYLNLTPDSTFVLSLKLLDINTKTPLQFSTLSNVEDFIFVRETYSLGFLGTYTSDGMCEDGTCLTYQLTFPLLGTVERAIYIIPFLVLNRDSNIDLALFCSDVTTKNNCVSKVLVIYPKPVDGTLKIEGVTRGDGTYYYGQNITIFVEDYTTYNIGDGGRELFTAIEIYDKDGLVDVINYDPDNDDPVSYELSENYLNENLTIRFVYAYENKFGDVLYYNFTKTIVVNDEFAYILEGDAIYFTYFDIGNNETTYEYLFPSSEFYIGVRSVLYGKDGTTVELSSGYGVVFGKITGPDKSYDLSVKYIGRDTIDNKQYNIYKVTLPNNITEDIISPRLKISFSYEKYGKSLRDEVYLTLPNIGQGNMIINQEEFFDEELLVLKGMLYEPSLLDFEEMGIAYVDLENSFKEVNFTKMEVENLDISSYNFTVAAELTASEKSDVAVVYVLMTYNGENILYEKEINILNQIPGYNIIIYKYYDGVKKRVSYDEIKFEHVYDVVERKYYIKNIGDKIIDLSKISIRYGNISIDNMEFFPVKNFDKKKDLLSPKEESFFNILFIPDYLENVSLFKIYHDKSVLESFKINYSIQIRNNTFDVEILNKDEIIYDKDSEEAKIIVEMYTDIKNLGQVGLEIKMSSGECPGNTIYEKDNVIVIKDTGKVSKSIIIKDRSLEKCTENPIFTVIAKRYEYNLSVVLDVEPFMVNIKRVEESTVGELISEIRDKLSELEELCSESNKDICADYDKYCSGIEEFEEKLEDIDPLDEKAKSDAKKLYTAISSNISSMKSCIIKGNRTQEFKEVRERFVSLYETLCLDEEAKKKIKKQLGYEDQNKFDTACSVHGRLYSEEMGSIESYEKGIRELEIYEEYLYYEEEPTNYGKIFGIFLIILILMIVVAVLVIKYFPSKEKVEVSEEDIYQI